MTGSFGFWSGESFQTGGATFYLSGQRRIRGELLRRECLDHLIVLDEQQLRSVLSEFVAYYNRDRPHRSLALRTPDVTDRRRAGKLVCRPILGGVHHSYEWAA